MDRRGMLGAIMGAFTAPAILSTNLSRPLIQGVGVIRYPSNRGGEPGRCARDQAALLANNIRQGTIIGLPNDRDHWGEYEWDFRIEGGDPGQVKVERQG